MAGLRLSMPFSQYLATAVLNWFKNTSFPAPGATVYLSLHTADPGTSGTNADVIATILGSANRVAVAGSGFTTPALVGGVLQVSNSGAISVTGSAANVSTLRVSHFGLWSANSGGSFLCSGELSAPIDVATGNVVQFNAGSLIIRAI